jgi:hypothetical protein
LLTDSGLWSVMTDPHFIVSAPPGEGGGKARWMAPELSDPNRADSRIMASIEADIYAFAMVVIEVFTGRFDSPTDLCC